MSVRLSFGPDALAALCRRHHIRRLSLFGSGLRGDARPDSDVDLLVEFVSGKEPGLRGLAGIEIELSQLLGGRKVDLRTPQDLSKHFREEVMRAAQGNMRPDDRTRILHMIEAAGAVSQSRFAYRKSHALAAIR